MKLVEGLNLAVRFLVLELGAVAATAYWGYQSSDGAVRWVLAVGAPSLVVVTWWLFVSPKAPVSVPRAARLGIELVVLGAAALALAATGHEKLAIGFAALGVVSGVLNYAWSD